MDTDSALVHTVVSTPANESDVDHVDLLPHGKEKTVHGAAGDTGAPQRVARIKQNGAPKGLVQINEERNPLRPAAGHRLKMQYSAAVHAVAFGATLILMPFAHAGPPLLDFSRPEVVQTFRVINDVVMGGVSTSRLSSTGGAMVFEGKVSLENNGGFASCRGPVRFPAESVALLLTVRGDGRRYKLTLKLDDSTSTPQYQAVFVAPREWQTLRFEAADFAASYRGRAVAAPRVELGAVRYFGLLISDRQSGAFKVELRDLGSE